MIIAENISKSRTFTIALIWVTIAVNLTHYLIRRKSYILRYFEWKLHLFWHFQHSKYAYTSDNCGILNDNCDKNEISTYMQFWIHCKNCAILNESCIAKLVPEVIIALLWLIIAVQVGTIAN